MMTKTNYSRIVTLGHAHKTLIDGIRREIDDAPLIVYELPTYALCFSKARTGGCG